MFKKCSFLSTFKALSSFHHTDHVVMVPVFARLESQVCRETQDPMGRQEFRAGPVPKDPRDHVEAKVTLENQEMKDPRDLQERWGRKGLRAQWAQEELKATPAIREPKALQGPRDLLAH